MRIRELKKEIAYLEDKIVESCTHEHGKRECVNFYGHNPEPYFRCVVCNARMYVDENREDAQPAVP
jgi:hypothetical protein